MPVPDTPEPEPVPGGSTGGGSSDGGSSGSSGGSSSGGSSSGGSSAPPSDPVEEQKKSLFRQIYIQLWGEPPTEAYVKAAANSGLNTWEFAELERNKPAFSQTETYKKKAQSLADLLLSMGVG